MLAFRCIDSGFSRGFYSDQAVKDSSESVEQFILVTGFGRETVDYSVELGSFRGFCRTSSAYVVDSFYTNISF